MCDWFLGRLCTLCQAPAPPSVLTRRSSYISRSIELAHLSACVFPQGPAMLNVQRLPVLTQLRLTGAGNLVGDVPVAMLALCLPPDLAVLQLAADYVSWPLDM